MEGLKERTLQIAVDLEKDYPDSPEAIGVLAIAHDRFGKSDDALRFWRNCRSLNPDFPDAYHGTASIFLKKGEYRQAADLSEKALDLNPSIPGVHALRAEALMGLGEFEEAVEVLDDGMKIFPESNEIFFWLGQAHLQLKDYEKAKENHQQAIRLDPKCTYAYYGLATAFARLGQREQFRRYMQDFRKLKEEDQNAELDRMKAFDDLAAMRENAAFVYAAVGEVHRRQQRLGKAESCLLEAGKLDQRDAMCKERLASLYIECGRMSDALAVLHQLRELEPRNPGHIVKIGLIDANLGRFDRAKQSLRTAIEIGPQWSGGYVALAQLLLQTGGDLSEAEQLALKAVELEPSAPNYYLLSATLHQSGEVSKATRAIERAIELAPNNAEYKRIHEALRTER